MNEENEVDAAIIEAKTPRKTRYRVKHHLDGAEECTVTIERGTTHQLVTVRPLGKRGTYTLSLKDVEAAHIQRILNETDWNISRAATVLEVDRGTLYHKIKKYRLERPSQHGG